MSARVLGQYLNENMPGKTYFYITSDYTWGHTSESSLRATGTVDTSKHQGVRTAFPGARLSDYRAALESCQQRRRGSGAGTVRRGHGARHAHRRRTRPEQEDADCRPQPDLVHGRTGRRTSCAACSAPSPGPASARAGRLRARQGLRAQLRRALPDAPSSSAASACSIVYQWADAVSRAKTIASEPVIAALENHSYSLLRANSSGERSIIRTSRRSTPCA